MRAGLAPLLVVGLLGACRGNETELVISVASNLEVPRELDGIGLRVRYPRDGRELNPDSWDLTSLPATIALFAGPDPDQPIEIELTGLKTKQPVVSRAARLRFARGRIVHLRLNLLRSCLAVRCEVGQTCGESGCEPIDKDVDRLPDFDPADLRGLEMGLPKDGPDAGPGEARPADLPFDLPPDIRPWDGKVPDQPPRTDQPLITKIDGRVDGRPADQALPDKAKPDSKLADSKIWPDGLPYPSIDLGPSLTCNQTHPKNCKPRTFATGGTQLVMSWCRMPAGCFNMGDGTPVANCSAPNPPNQIRITRSFELSQTEVTEAEFASLMSYPVVTCKDCPVSKVTWHEAAEFCNKLSDAAGLPRCLACAPDTLGQMKCNQFVPKTDYLGCRGFRLPSEAEWEYATRAGTQTDTHAGNLTDCNTCPVVGGIAWYQSNSSAKKAVMLKAPNPIGLHDVSGNVWEWVFDSWQNNLSTDTDPLVVWPTPDHAIKGGSFTYPASYSRSGARYSEKNARPDLGFRCAISVP